MWSAMIFTVNYISRSKCRIIEGQLRCQELANYLDKMDLPKCVWICEDGSGINAKTEYDPYTNQLIGLVLPTNPKTGNPIPFTFIVDSAEDIQKHTKQPLSTLVYAVLALPLQPDAPPFVLQIYGTNNTFTGDQVLNRWKYTIKELQKYVIFDEIFNHVY